MIPPLLSSPFFYFFFSKKKAKLHGRPSSPFLSFLHFASRFLPSLLPTSIISFIYQQASGGASFLSLKHPQGRELQGRREVMIFSSILVHVVCLLMLSTWSWPRERKPISPLFLLTWPNPRGKFWGNVWFLLNHVICCLYEWLWVICWWLISCFEEKNGNLVILGFLHILKRGKMWILVVGTWDWFVILTG